MRAVYHADLFIFLLSFWFIGFGKEKMISLDRGLAKVQFHASQLAYFVVMCSNTLVHVLLESGLVTHDTFGSWGEQILLFPFP